MLQWKYGISVSDYEERLTAQKNLCKSCGNKAKLVVDHCHTTNEVRSLLCSPCNIALGVLQENPVNIAGLLAYASNL